MKKNLSHVFQAIILLLGLIVLFMMIRMPQTEGRAKDLDLFHIYSDPFILYGYAASIPFFIGLYKAFRLLGFAGQNKLYTSQALSALSSIWYCAIIFAVLVAGAGLYIRFFHHKDDDPAGFLAICMLATLGAALVTISAVRFEKKLKNGMDEVSK